MTTTDYGYRLTSDKIQDAHRIDRLCMQLVCSLGYIAFRESVQRRIDYAQAGGRDRWEECDWWQAVYERLDELEEGMQR